MAYLTCGVCNKVLATFKATDPDYYQFNYEINTEIEVICPQCYATLKDKVDSFSEEVANIKREINTLRDWDIQDIVDARLDYRNYQGDD